MCECLKPNCEYTYVDKLCFYSDVATVGTKATCMFIQHVAAANWMCASILAEPPTAESPLQL